MPWVNCDVTTAGPAENGTIYIGLRAKDNSFNNWFQAVPAMKKEMLATALAAIGGSKPVTVYVTGTAPYSEIQRLYINAA